MSIKSRPFNFAAGPAALPLEVIEQVSRDVMDFKGQGISLLEQGHRTPVFSEIRDALKSSLKELLELDENHEIVCLQGGARQQFAMTLLNFCHGGLTPAYINTGHWGYRASVEADMGGYNPKIYWTDRDNGYRKIPEKPIEISKKHAFVHVTGNETIHGVQIPEDPDLIVKTDNPIIMDTSSDLLSRPLPCKKYGMIYACAQKNLGVVGNTVVIIRRDLLEASREDLPPVFAYKNLVKLDSIYNTAPVLPIYVSLLMCQWIKKEFGSLAGVAKFNQQKADMLYELLDKYPDFYVDHSEVSARSTMNVILKFKKPELQEKFLEQAAAKGFMNIKGHRELGGIRVSNYNAVSLEAVESLRDFMDAFVGQS